MGPLEPISADNAIGNTNNEDFEYMLLQAPKPKASAKLFYGCLSPRPHVCVTGVMSSAYSTMLYMWYISQYM